MSMYKITMISFLTVLLAVAQDKPGPAPAVVRKPAAAAAPSPVDSVIQLVKAGMSEALIIKNLQRQNKPANLSMEDMAKLQKAGVSENIITTMMDPGAAPTVAGPAAAAVAPAPQPAAPVPAPAQPAIAPTAAVDCPAPAAVSAVPGSQKRRLAVQAFDYSAVRTQVSGIFGNDINIGQGIRAMLTAKMGQSKSIVLLEREKLQSVLTEQDLGGSNRVRQGTKAKIGKITGADAILMGDIVIFGRDDTTKKTNGAAIGRVFGGPLGGLAAGAGKKTEKAVVAINMRLVDAETGEVLETTEARGESKRVSTDWGAIGAGWTGATAGAAAASSSMASSNFESTIIGEATKAAVDDMAAKLEQKVPAIAAKSREIEGRVATMEGCTLYLSVGGNDGVHVGDRFEIHQIINEVLDPETKEVLDKQTVKVGEFIAATVRDKVTIGQYGGQPLSKAYTKGYAARMVTQ